MLQIVFHFIVRGQMVDTVFSFAHPDVLVPVFYDIVGAIHGDGQVEGFYGQFILCDNQWAQLVARYPDFPVFPFQNGDDITIECLAVLPFCLRAETIGSRVVHLYSRVGTYQQVSFVVLKQGTDVVVA